MMKTALMLLIVSVLVALFPTGSESDYNPGKMCKDAGQGCYEGSEKYHQYEGCCQANFVCDYRYKQDIYPGTCVRKTSDYQHLVWHPKPRPY